MTAILYRLRSFVHREPAVVGVAAIPLVALYAIIRAVTGEGVHLNGNVSGEVADLLSFSLSCALLSYGTVEALKRIVPMRGWFQQHQTRLWLERHPAGAEASWELIRLMELEDSVAAHRAFNLPVEQLAAQIGAAADLALGEVPDRSPLVAALAGSVKRHPAFASVSGQGVPSRSMGDPDETFELAQRVRVGIDRLQISVGEQWRRTVQGATMSLAGLYGIGLVHAAHLADRSEPRYVLAALLLGGPIAWTLRDAAALLERVRH
jgi:hypothetical protein